MNNIFKRTHLSLLIFCGMLALGIGLSGIEQPDLSWAAPEQNPYAQTVPTRFPEETTEPPPAPSPVSLSPTRQQADNDNQDDEARQVTATPPVRETKSPQVNVSPTPPPASTVQAQPDQSPSEGTAEPQEASPTPQPPLEEGGETQILATPTSSPTPLPAATQADKNQATRSLNSEAKAGFLPAEKGSLWWVYALMAGIILLGGGIALIRRA